MPRSDSFFIDTNVLVYRADDRDMRKYERATLLLRALAGAECGVVSTQVASELANVLGTKFRDTVPNAVRRQYVRDLFDDWDVIVVDDRVIDLALEGQDRFGFSYYDAQVWAAAVIGGATVVLTEDFADGSEALGVRFVDPFADGFDVDELLAD
jgi:predicted nucleic acid-binding protein